jgi:hypothetical protein
LRVLCIPWCRCKEEERVLSVVSERESKQGLFIFCLFVTEEVWDHHFLERLCISWSGCKEPYFEKKKVRGRKMENKREKNLLLVNSISKCLQKVVDVRSIKVLFNKLFGIFQERNHLTADLQRTEQK